MRLAGIENTYAYTYTGAQAFTSSNRFPIPRFGKHNDSNDLSSNLTKDNLFKKALIHKLVQVFPGTSTRFVRDVRAAMERHLSTEALKLMLDDGYRYILKRYITQGRKDIGIENDTRSGLHRRGADTSIWLAHRITNNAGSNNPNDWYESACWQNAVIHETGHAIAFNTGKSQAKNMKAPINKKVEKRLRLDGISEHPDFVKAWKADFRAMPDKMKKYYFPDGTRNFLYYFVQPQQEHLSRRGKTYAAYIRSRQEVFAESFDILTRGPLSDFNYQNFLKHFPNSLKATHKLAGNLIIPDETVIGELYGKKASSDNQRLTLQRV